METSANRLLALEYLARIEAGNLPAALELVSDDAVFWLPNTGDMDKAAFTRFLGAVLPVIRTMKFTIRGVTEEGHRVAVEVEGRAELNNERIYSNHYHFLFIIRDGLLRQVKEFTDSAPAVEAFRP
ncbi:nuclear transport factor 2 family protein [Pseudomonas inefficax]|uniref:nuclear transport factor 2 family protein n=1 Tax=Pseudomonas inefficax TaxID=2078786 RepID=UPI004046A7C4